LLRGQKEGWGKGASKKKPIKPLLSENRAQVELSAFEWGEQGGVTTLSGRGEQYLRTKMQSRKGGKRGGF